MPIDKAKAAARYKRYRESHKEACLARCHAYYQAHKEEILAKNRAYKKAHRKQINARERIYQRERYIPSTKEPVYAGIDGEAHREPDGRSVYSYLRASHLPPLINRKGLTTKAIFEYLFKIPPGVTVCGFVLNYDWENWLRDIPDKAYLFLTGDTTALPDQEEDNWQIITKETEEGEEVRGNTIVWEGYTINYFPRKIFSITKIGKNGKPRMRKVMDLWGYCQSSFLKACSDWDVATEEELAPVKEGKEKRDIFSWDELEYIAHYNELELDLMAKLAEKILEGVKKACEIADLPIKPSATDLYGPGAIARKVLKKLNWPENIGRTPIPEQHKKIYLDTVRAAEAKQKDYLLSFPIIASYYGGRIEAAATGRFKKVYDYDLHSAYPSAITRLPFMPLHCTWKNFTHPGYAWSWTRRRRTVGMYYCMWDFPKGWNWYPFPTRQKKYQNVFYPHNGQGWIASPELFAALDTIPGAEKFIRIYHAWTVPCTDGTGGGESPLPENLKSPIARLIEKMYVVRAEAKRGGLKGAQMALKLILNSMYGKLLQQVGVSLKKPGLFHDLVASWITSWTRAMIYRAIAPHRQGKNIIAIQTDGIVTKTQLLLTLTPDLADWEVEELPDYRQLLPGLYDYQAADKRKVRRRGMPASFNFDKAWATMHHPGQTYEVKFRTFLGRRLYLAQPFEYVGQLYQWPEMTKNFRPDLGAKRGNPLAPVAVGAKFGDAYLKGRKEMWLPPKINTLTGPGLPFVLKFEEPSYIPKEAWEIENAKLEESMEEATGFFRE